MLLSFTSPTEYKVTVKGKVIDEKGEALVGVSVFSKDRKIGTRTDENGTFVLKLESAPSKMMFSKVGYQTLEKKVSKKDLKDSVIVMNVTLKTAVAKLEEVVVVGYAATKAKKNTTKSVAVMDAATYLAGKPAGSVTFATDKEVGVKVRGASSVAEVYDAIDIPTTKKPEVSVKEKDPVKQSSLLTAGEVNDFKKWKMWEDYNESEFKTHSERWGLYATDRYSVQLQNKAFKAVVGQAIYLINRTNGDTLWTAVSDNTGKAELWNGFDKKTKEKDLFIALQNEKTEYPAVPFEQGVNRIVIDRPCAVSNKVEIAFLVDATGSMSDEISYLKEELEDIITKISTKNKLIDLHTGSVFYRDNGDAYVTKKQAFSKGISSTIDFIREQSAGGGGDYPEALKEGLEETIEKMNWSADARTKIIFLLMDAPPHDEAKTAMTKLTADAAAKGIRIVPVACSGTDKGTEFIMRSMALATNGTYLFLTDDSGIGDTHIKPTTDEFKVELLNDLLQRVIEQMCYVNTCDAKSESPAPMAIITNTEKVKVYPNPTNGPVTLETNKALKEVFVTDFTGKILIHKDAKAIKGNISFDLTGFPSATYLIKYVTTEGKQGAEKVVLIR
ncbi:carboxypeptidase-like regulatory domain-containing protein [Ferruginibacter sp. SUN002]|uniref:carboxypeptidase-like regulatory domain-containing protein n=1 Tax=Ferruginibacter sp. SUN002 TaxID=2937789 RepID=UPI003D36C8FC